VKADKKIYIKGGGKYYIEILTRLIWRYNVVVLCSHSQLCAECILITSLSLIFTARDEGEFCNRERL